MDYKPSLVRGSVFVYKWGRHGLHTIPQPILAGYMVLPGS